MYVPAGISSPKDLHSVKVCCTSSIFVISAFKTFVAIFHRCLLYESIRSASSHWRTRSLLTTSSSKFSNNDFLVDSILSFMIDSKSFCRSSKAAAISRSVLQVLYIAFSFRSKSTPESIEPRTSSLAPNTPSNKENLLLSNSYTRQSA